ncbi:hypothetical protein NESM_000757400 [Novymonas esmeraldas]|uniref:Leucine zipper transcription factor-like protein 1 n=1 Tax=Novymonas esmeraldas TaxID=1808958 RepID=A0AAW0EY10_9TRYP
MDPMGGLTSESRTVVDSFFRWSRLSLDKFKRDLTVEASAFQSGNVWRETYTKAEVAQMLSGQLALLLGVVDTQMEGTTAASAELMRAVLREADLQRLVLHVDATAVLNNAGGVNAMGEHGRQLLSGPTGRLAPLTLAEAGGEAARQLSEANAEVRRLQAKLQQVTDAYTQVMGGRSSDTANLLSMQDAMNDKERLATELARRCSGQDPSLSAAVQGLRAEVAEAKRELATRLNQSTQYQQVKQLLAQRNAELKAMRQRLAAFDPSFAQRVDDIAAEDD